MDTAHSCLYTNAKVRLVIENRSYTRRTHRHIYVCVCVYTRTATTKTAKIDNNNIFIKQCIINTIVGIDRHEEPGARYLHGPYDDGDTKRALLLSFRKPIRD